MHFTSLVTGLAAVSSVVAAPSSRHNSSSSFKDIKPVKQVELGPRPYFLVRDMDEGPLKKKLESCTEKKMKTSAWSIGHRGGGSMQIPEHSLEANLAGARMGAGTLECDVAFTKDRQLVCRHAQCDLHTTTNIVNVPELAKKCTQPFKPAANGKPASAKCCTSDLTLNEFKSLCAKMDGFNATATTPADFLAGTANWRTDLYATCGTLLSHREHIDVVDRLGLSFAPELKKPEVAMPFEGDYTQEMYAQQFIDDYKRAGIKPERVWPQSFNYPDVLYWLKAEPKYARQAVYLDETGDTPETFPNAVKNLTQIAKDGTAVVAPPLHYLVKSEKGKIVPSEYAIKARELGLDIMTWSLERSGPLAKVAASKDYYYGSILDVVNNDGDIFTFVDVLFRQVGVIGLFSDWTATTTYYANCMGIKGNGKKNHEYKN